MSRPIDADAMRQEWLENGENEHVYDTNAMLNSIDQQPTINPEDLRPKGKWIGIEYDGYADGCPVYDLWECSNCGNEEKGEDVPEQNPFCRCCGAKMEV